MENTFYRLSDDNRIPDRWFLGSPVDQAGVGLDPRVFTYGNTLDIQGPLYLPKRQDGQPLAFTLADFDMPVVREDLAATIAKIAPAELQRIPVAVEGESDNYEILNALRVVDCLDYDHSKVTLWNDGDGRPDKVGLPRMVTDLRVDSDRIGTTRLLRVAHWRIALVVSQNIAECIREYSGVRLEQVS